MAAYPEPILRLIDKLKRLPGVGPKTAERFVMHLLSLGPGELMDTSQALAGLASVITCERCCNYAAESPCRLCRNPNRDSATVCVVSRPQDIAALERTGRYQGLYHMLGGTLSASAGTTPDDLNVSSLMARVKHDAVSEVILALNPDMDGEATSLYLASQLKPERITVTRLARGLPLGADLEYADEVTLTDALEQRRQA